MKWSGVNVESKKEEKEEEEGCGRMDGMEDGG